MIKQQRRKKNPINKKQKLNWIFIRICTFHKFYLCFREEKEKRKWKSHCVMNIKGKIRRKSQ